MISRRRLSAASVVIALALVAAACSSGGGKKKASASSTAPATTTTTVPPVFPLTGLPAGTSPNLNRPALVVKIENVPEARPQSGLIEADVVYEEIVEAGLSRFIVVYQSKDADPVGPVRSIPATIVSAARDAGSLDRRPSAAPRPFQAVMSVSTSPR